MKKAILAVIGALGALGAMGAESPLWLRNVAISPDGATVAFTYKGDIFTVSAQGGTARQLTSNPAYDTAPVWSPDGRQIAFSSSRDGSTDVFVIPATGGTARRLTTHSGAETPRAWLNDSTILFTASDMPAAEAAQGPFASQVYSVSTKGTRPRMYSTIPMASISVGPGGALLYQDRKGYENAYRKHEMSSSTGDIRLIQDGKDTKLTTFKGNDQEPVWTSADSFAYLSEENGTLNVYTSKLNGSDKRRITDFKKHPVRSLSAAGNGTLAFSWDGEIYTVSPGGQPRKLDVAIVSDDYDRDQVDQLRRSGATSMAVSPTGKEVAFVIRGDVYVTSVEYPTTKRITNTPGQERNVSFSKDGRTLVYDSERDGQWQLFTSKIKNPDEKQFTYATDLVEDLLYAPADGLAAQQPEYSPDGKKIAFWEDRHTLRVIDPKTKAVNTALDGKYNYSYSDGDLSFSWSPDSRHLLTSTIGIGGWNNTDIAIVSADGKEYLDLTESGYSDANPRWALGGEALTWESAKYGYKSHGSWGNESDVLFMALTPEAYDKLHMTDEEAALEKEAKEEADKAKADDKDKNKDKKGKKKGKKADEEPEAPVIAFDFDNRALRIERLTPRSGHIGDYVLSKDGDKLYYTTADATGKTNLMEYNLRKGDTKVLANGVSGGIIPDEKLENIYVMSYSGMKKIDLKSGKADQIEFEAVYDRKPSKEREYIFDHMLSQVRDKFYDVNLHGVDWAGYGEAYRRFLPHIDNNEDFAILLSEILGELNASHTGGRHYGAFDYSTASLGAWFDDDYQGEGLRVAEIVPGSPLSTSKAGVKAGDIITAIDGKTITPGMDYYPLLSDKEGKKVRLTVQGGNGSVRDITVKPISRGDLSDLLYRRWVRRNQAMADSLSGGRVGYVHVKGMDSPSFREVYSELLGKYRNYEAVIVDTRWNGGGWLHNDLAQLLSGKEYVKYVPRGQYIGSDPFSQWTKPSVMLVNEANYSDAHGSPYAYQTLGIGDVVGAPVPGTMTAVWWETQIDPTLVFGIPEVTSVGVEGKPMENNQLQPDVEVYNDPTEVAAGIDSQIAKSVEVLLKKLDAK